MSTGEYALIGAGVLVLALLLYALGRRLRRSGRAQGPTGYAEALRHLVNNEVDLAYRALVDSVRRDTSNVDAYILLGDLLRQRGNHERALKVHRDVSVRTDLPSSVDRVLLRSLALDYMAVRRWAAAERSLRELERLTRGDSWARLRLLEVYEAQNHWSAAYELGLKMQDHPQVGPSRVAHYRMRQASALLSEGQNHKARLLFKEAIKHDPGLADAYVAIGDSYSEEGRIDDAASWWEQLAGAVPERAGEMFARLEEVLYEVGRFERMGEIYEGFLEAHPGNLDGTLAYARFMQRKGQLQPAIDMLERLRPRSVDKLRIDRALVLLYYRAGERDRALSLALKVCEAGEGAQAGEGSAPAVASVERPGWMGGGVWDPSTDERESNG